MIKKALLTTLVLLVFYSIATQFINKNFVANNMNERNFIKADQVNYLNLEGKKIIVGSSIAHRLALEGRQDFHNLSLEGKSALTSMEILIEQGIKPKMLLIETNVFLPIDHDLVDYSTNIIFSNLRQNVPILRVEQKPSRYMMPIMMNQGKLGKVYVGLNEMVKTVFPASKQVSQTQQVKNTVMPKVNLPDLKRQLAYFEKQGTQIVFFDMPAGCNEQHTYLAKLMRENFPHIPFLPTANCADFPTSDATHLTQESAQKYTHFWLKEVEKIEK
ncbi:MAG: hypothetical protein EAZ95_15205 [Bacteroidetes bacterium]|nr:MAG: hypothetical protein EAZ95_15205 [Bacteroidota bacterium]